MFYNLFKKKFLWLIVLVSIVLLVTVSYLEFALNQQYILKQFQIVFTQIQEETLQDFPDEIIEIQGTDFVAAGDTDKLIENGIKIRDNNFSVFLDKKADIHSHDEFGIHSVSDIYSEYLLYRFSVYVTPKVIGLFLVISTFMYLFIASILYVLVRLYEYMQIRTGHIDREVNLSFSIISRIIIMSIFVGSGLYSYFGILFNKEIGMIIGIVLMLITLFILNKKRKIIKGKIWKKY
ncbi:MAG: hypothetical protein ACRC5R_05950 [Mycoplasmatales bacterium]